MLRLLWLVVAACVVRANQNQYQGHANQNFNDYRQIPAAEPQGYSAPGSPPNPADRMQPPYHFSGPPAQFPNQDEGQSRYQSQQMMSGRLPQNKYPQQTNQFQRNSVVPYNGKAGMGILASIRIIVVSFRTPEFCAATRGRTLFKVSIYSSC